MENCYSMKTYKINKPKYKNFMSSEKVKSKRRPTKKDSAYICLKKFNI